METPKELVLKRTNLNPEIGMGKVMVQLMNEYASLVDETKDLSSQSIKGAADDRTYLSDSQIEEMAEKNFKSLPLTGNSDYDSGYHLGYTKGYRKAMQEFAQQHILINDEKLYAELKKDLEESDKRELGHYKPEEIVGESIDDKYASFGLRNRNIPSDEAISIDQFLSKYNFILHPSRSGKDRYLTDEPYLYDNVKRLLIMFYSKLSLPSGEALKEAAREYFQVDTNISTHRLKYMLAEKSIDFIKHLQSKLKPIDVKADTKIQDLLLDMTNKEKSKFLKWIAKQEFKSE